MCISHFFTFFSVSTHILSLTVCFSYSTVFCFLPYSMPYIVHFSLFTFFRFLSIFHVLQCAFLFFHVFHNFFLPKCHVLQRAFLILTFLSFSHHVPSTTVCISHFPRFSIFLAIFQVLNCPFLIFYVFQFSRHNQVLECAFFTRS